MWCKATAALATVIGHEIHRKATVHRERQQAKRTRLPLRLVKLPFPCSNEIYEARMSALIATAQSEGIEAVAFGDLYLAEVRQYRERASRRCFHYGSGLLPNWRRR